MKKKIICLIGNKRCGKDYTFGIIQANTSLKTKRYAFADILKKEYLADFNQFVWAEEDEVTLDKLEKDKESHRTGLQNWGDYRRSQNENYFIENTLKDIIEDKEIELSVITDCRFLNEQNQLILFAFKNDIELLFVKVNNIHIKETDSHISEAQVKNIFANIILENDYSPKYKNLVLKELSSFI